jgi:hypothetical protein
MQPIRNETSASLKRLATLMAIVGATAAGLAACGGGGDSPSPTPAPVTPPSPPPPAPPPPAAPGTVISGKLYGPTGAQVTLQNNGGDDLVASVLASAGGPYPYDATAFAFTTKLLDGVAYAATLKTVPAGMACSVYHGGTGTMPVAASALRVGCEYLFDHVNRSTDDSVVGTYYDTYHYSVGGSDEPIGTTTQGYGEGRFVAFTSSAAAPGASNGYRQVYWRDRYDGTTYLVSAVGDVPGNDNSYAPAISADGMTVVFESSANNLVANDTNAVSDIFVWSRLDPGTLTRVSVGAGGVQANGTSNEPTVSGDGKVVAFSSGASNLTGGVSGNSTINVIRRDLASGTNTLVTSDYSNGSGVGGARPHLSEDGTRLAFYSYSSKIVPGDVNALWDVFVYDSGTGAKSRVSLASTGGERNQGNESTSRIVAPVISGDGRYVAYATTSTNVVPNDNNDKQDVFVVDTQTGSVVRASVGNGGTQGNADSPIGQGERLSISYDGAWVAFSTSANNIGAGAGGSGVGNVVMRNWVTGETKAVTDKTTGSVSTTSMSRKAGYVLFSSSNALDARFTASGLFAAFTGLRPSFAWEQ